jgi:hypothetical protein
VRSWRNWQTHQLEGLALARAWWFESTRPQIYCRKGLFDGPFRFLSARARAPALTHEAGASLDGAMTDPTSYSWYSAYQRAEHETDYARLADRIDEALNAIEHRLAQGRLDDREFTELQAALRSLVLLPY